MYSLKYYSNVNFDKLEIFIEKVIKNFVLN